MAVATPADMPATFARLFNARDLGGLVGLYSDDAVLTLDGAAVARGHGEIERMIVPLLSGPLQIAIHCATCHERGDVALVRSDWKLIGPDGAVAMAGASAEVLRRGADGRWRFVIDDACFASRPHIG